MPTVSVQEGMASAGGLENESPLARTQYKKMYLHSGGTQGDGRLSWDLPADEKTDSYRYDPDADVLVYTSDYLQEPVEVSSCCTADALDTDFAAKLIDVYPDGRSFNMAEGIVRARYREGMDKPKLLEPGKTYEMTIDMVATSVEFQKGHRILSMSRRATSITRAPRRRISCCR